MSTRSLVFETLPQGILIDIVNDNEQQYKAA
jgi:hypothetical protein